MRNSAASRRHPHFSRAALSAALNEHGVLYHWLGEKLGGYRTDGYEAYTNTEDFRQGCDELIRLAQLHPLAFMCAELDYRACHRRFIATYLQQRGLEIWHVDKKGELLSHVQAKLKETMPIPF